MIRRLVTVGAIASLSVFATLNLRADDNLKDGRPAAPDGFSWKRLEDVKITVLVPNGWEVTRLERNGTICYKVTLDKTLRTGLTINVITNVTDKTKQLTKALGKTVNAPLYAAYQIEQYKDRSTRVVDEWTRESSAFAVYGCEVIRNTDGAESHIRTTAIGNKKTDTMYVWMFGSPADSWDNSWKFGSRMLNPILIDDEF